jgi:hypothetical protein
MNDALKGAGVNICIDFSMHPIIIDLAVVKEPLTIDSCNSGDTRSKIFRNTLPNIPAYI